MALKSEKIQSELATACLYVHNAVRIVRIVHPSSFRWGPGLGEGVTPKAALRREAIQVLTIKCNR